MSRPFSRCEILKQATRPNVLLWIGRNQDLRQETARSWTVSVELTQNHPIDLKLRSLLRWQIGALVFFGALNYLNGYQDVVSAPMRRVGSWTTVDVHVAYTVPSQTLGATTLALGADNFLDRDPPFLNNSAAAIGFNQENGDLTGRMVSLSLRTRW